MTDETLTLEQIERMREATVDFLLTELPKYRQDTTGLREAYNAVFAAARAHLEAREGDGGELVERLRRYHDALNCNVDAGGRRFKTDSEKENEVASAMEACWKAADLLTAKEAELSALKADNERLRADLDEAVGLLRKLETAADAMGDEANMSMADEAIEAARAFLSRHEGKSNA